MSKAKVIIASMEKGGVGKSSTIQNIGVILHQLGKRVLCVDNDSQSHLSISYNILQPESLEITLTNLYEMITQQIPITEEIMQKAIVKTKTVDVLPSTFLMNRLDVALNAMTAREYALNYILDPVMELFDYILIDCNSANNIFTTNALACADEAILPCQTQYLASGGIPLMLSAIKSIKKRINPKLEFKGILLTMYQSNTNQSKNTVEQIKKEYIGKVFNTIIPMSTKVPDAQKQGLSVIEYDKNNPVSIAYRDFVMKELIS